MEQQLTPMMQQYMETKKEYPDCILFYRLGDFYEMFYEDALIASKVLEITLTGKSCGLEERAPMCGIPYHAVDSYLNKMVSEGYKVAICEQMEDPKQTKGIVKREVIRIVTPGTNLNMQALEEGKNNYIMSIAYFTDKIGVSFADVTTGEYRLTEIADTKKLMDEIAKLLPVEIICNDAFMVSDMDMDTLKNRFGITVYHIDSWHFEETSCKKTLQEHFHISSLTGLGIEDFPAGIIASGALLQYLYETQKISLSHMTHLDPYISSKYMLLDSSTRRNLELCETMREKQKRGTLLWILDKTKTAMGARMLRSFIEQPLVNLEDIVLRQKAIAALCEKPVDRDEIREYLGEIYDLERLLAKISYKSVNPRDMIAFRNSLKMLPFIRMILQGFDQELLHTLYEGIDALEDICGKIEAAIVEEPPISTRDGGIIKEGYDLDIDKLRNAKTEGKTWLAEMEASERERTGIKNLRLKYNKVFGYYLEVTNSYKELVPEEYIRKQTLTNAERYTTPRLKELEDMILNAEDKLFTLEYDAFAALRDDINDNL